MFNIIDLIQNDEAAGWAPTMKGFYDIEADPKAAPTVVQAAPLAVIAAAVLQRDEALFVSRALPVIEYTLSRGGFRWAQAGMSKKAGTLSPYNSQFTTAYFDGLHHLLGEANPGSKVSRCRMVKFVKQAVIRCPFLPGRRSLRRGG